MKCFYMHTKATSSKIMISTLSIHEQYPHKTASKNVVEFKFQLRTEQLSQPAYTN